MRSPSEGETRTWSFSYADKIGARAAGGSRLHTPEESHSDRSIAERSIEAAVAVKQQELLEPPVRSLPPALSGPLRCAVSEALHEGACDGEAGDVCQGFTNN